MSKELTYWKHKQTEAILKRKRTKCSSCGGTGYVKTIEAVTVMLCNNCNAPIRFMVEQPVTLTQLVG